MTISPRAATLVLADGSQWPGFHCGGLTGTHGEVVFNTGMTGYPESLTDPSYAGQILVFTYPLLGNYGVPGDEREEGLLRGFESERIQVRAMVAAEIGAEYEHWHSVRSLPGWLEEQGVPAIYGVDTRALTRRLREAGVMRGRLEVEGAETPPAVETANWAATVSVREPVEYAAGKKTLALVDCGVKNNIIRAFLRRGFTVLRVPWDYDFLSLGADGIVLSNGPGDPAACAATVENVRRALGGRTPILGICLGSQILGLAAGARTYKLKYGHRGHNQPCAEAGTKRCYITSQNHGYAVAADSLPQDWREWFVNYNDGSNEGILHISRPFFGAQFHPEASPGPDDTEFIFDMFSRAVRQ